MKTKKNPKATSKTTKAQAAVNLPAKSAVHTLLALQSDLEHVAPAEHVSRVDALIAEAELLATSSKKFRAALVAVGTDPTCIDSLPQRTEAVKGAATLVRRNARGRWKEEVAVDEYATVLVSEMMVIGRFATRNNPESQRVLDGIAEGTGPDDRLTDLRDLSDFFSLNDAAIRTTGADPKALAIEALETEAKLGALVRERRLRDASATLDTDARDRAIAHLVAAMREVRDGGAFAFRKDPRKAKFFRAMLPKRATRKKPEAQVTPAQPE